MGTGLTESDVNVNSSAVGFFGSVVSLSLASRDGESQRRAERKDDLTGRSLAFASVSHRCIPVAIFRCDFRTAATD
jgi:hypothetical protein